MRGGFRLEDVTVAASLLTRAPVKVDFAAAAERAGASAWAWPLIGALAGLSGGLVYLLATWLGAAQGPAAALALAAQAAATGALHEDGLADAADGLLGGRDRAHALEIMRDSRIGSFGATALILALLARWSAIAATPPLAALLVLATSGALSRAAMACVMTALPPARRDGLAHGAGRPEPEAALAAVGAAVVLALLSGWSGLAAALLAALAALAVAWLASKRIDGQTGDTLGAVQQCAEVAALLALAGAA